jgi:hypothetical protein
MNIEKDSKHIFIRLIDYKKNNFMEEHLKAFEKKGYVWILKMGKPSKIDYLKEVIENKGGLITKSTARNGNKFYYCKLDSYTPDKTLYYPEYYKEIFEDGYYDISKPDSLGTWFKVTSITEIPDSTVNKFVTISTERSLLECGKKFNQVSQMHVKAKENIKI